MNEYNDFCMVNSRSKDLIDSISNDRPAWLFWSVFLTYVCLIIVWSCFHDVWRDEVLPVTLVIQSNSFFDLFHQIRNYGHPGLWFAILYWAYHIYPHYSVLKIVNVSVNALAAFIFLRKSPFSWVHKILFLLGYFPFYYFPVVNRMYGLCWLLFLCCCVLYSQRWQKILSLSMVLFLLSNAHVEGLIITIAIGLVLGVEFVLQKSNILKQNSLKEILLGAVIITAGIILSVNQLRTDSTSIILSASPFQWQQIPEALKEAVFLPGQVFRHLLGDEHIKLVTFAIVGCYFLMRKQWGGLGIMFLSTVGLSLFLHLIYPWYGLYHESFVYMLMIFSFWITHGRQKKGSIGYYSWNLFLTAILLTQVFMAYPVIRADVSSDFSSSKRFAQWINTQPSGKKYVLMGEPDYLIESMPYYVSNDIYVPREHRFSKITLDTNVNQKVFSLEDFLHTAEALKAQGKDVLLVMGQDLKPQGPFEISFSYDKIFKYSPLSLKLWDLKARKVAGFHGAFYSDENYDVYMLK